MKKSKLLLKYKEYINLNGQEQRLVQQVGDGSIIKRFDRTPSPIKPEDVICPHFLELKWSYGCPYHCAWCYLQGTLRFLPSKTNPIIKDYSKIRLHLESFFAETVSNGYIPEILNAGEIADSLMAENDITPFSQFITDIFETQEKHKILFLSKSGNINNIIRLGSNKLLPSFTLNAFSVSKRWEMRAPSIEKRINDAKVLSDSGYPIRIRIDPIVPIENWEKEYLDLIDALFSEFRPERVTLGSLRGLQSTINNAYDKSWTSYLSERSNWGRKVDSAIRYSIYKCVINYLRDNYNYTSIALCKETKAIWEELVIDYHSIKCNCVW
jgi:spore photoproduct lyase